MFEVAWMEFNKKNEIVTKRKSFSTEKALNRFIEKLFEKDNLYQIIGTR